MSATVVLSRKRTYRSFTCDQNSWAGQPPSSEQGSPGRKRHPGLDPDVKVLVKPVDVEAMRKLVVDALARWN